MGDALRWLVLGHVAYALGLLPWALLLAVLLRTRGRPVSPPHVGMRPLERLPQPPLMDLSEQLFDPAPPAWAAHYGSGVPDPVESPPAVPSPDPAPDSTEEQPRNRRVALAEARDLARNALLRLSLSGYYAFEDLLVSGVGAIDQLVIGPAGLRVLLVAPQRGHVWREAGGEITYSTDAQVDLEAGRIEGTFESPEEDLDAIATALAEDVLSKLGNAEARVWPIVVFPHAEVYAGPGGGHNIMSAWDLAKAVEYTEDEPLSAEAVETLASLIARAYGREPWMRPTPDHEPCPDA